MAYFEVTRRDGSRGLTTEMAFVVTYLLGVFSTTTGIVEPPTHRAITTVALAVVVTLLLSAKPPLHRLAKTVKKDDIFAALKFLIVAVIVLPLLPNRTFGPLAVLNPFKVGLMVSLIAGIDFFGYMTVRFLGPGRALGLMGLVGGLASSTAVMLSVSNRAKEEPRLAPACALAATLASSVMAPRVLLMVAVVDPKMVSALWPPLAAVAIAGGGASWVLYRRSRSESPPSAKPLELSNPFELGSALKWGALFTVVLFVTKLAYVKLGQSGSYVAGLLSGTTDVDAITLSMANLTKAGEIGTQVAVTTVMLAVASNTIVKASMATVIGGWRYGRMIAASFGAMLAGSALGLGWLWLG